MLAVHTMAQETEDACKWEEPRVDRDTIEAVQAWIFNCIERRELSIRLLEKGDAGQDPLVSEVLQCWYVQMGTAV